MNLPTPSGAGSLGYNHDLVISAPISVVVEPVYVGNQNWNDYVKYLDGNSEDYEQVNTSCDGTEAGYYGEINGCIHGGEKRKVVVTNFTSCASLTLVESLGVFEWFCEDASGTAIFFTKGLKDGMGLSDLITTGGAWKSNSVIIQQGGMTVAQSAASFWWSNTISEVVANSANLTNLNVAGTIYYTSPSVVTTLGIKITAQKVALVSLGSGSIQSTGVSTNNFAIGDCYVSSSALAEMVCSGSQNFLWLETEINGTNGTWPLVVGMNLVGTRFIRIHKTKIKNLKNNSNTMAAIELGASGYLSQSNLITATSADGVGKMGGMRITGTYNIVRDFGVSRNTDPSSTGQTLFMLTGSASYNRLENVRLSHLYAGGSSKGLKILGSNNIISGLNISNIGPNTYTNSAIYLAASNNIISQATLFGASDAGIFIEGSTAITNNVIKHVTSVNNQFNGMYLTGTVNSTYVHSFVTMNTDKGIQSLAGGGGTGNVFHDIVSGNHTNAAVELQGSQEVAFTGFFHKGSTGNTCSGGGLSTNCGLNPIITDLATAFVGKVFTDGVNGSAASGTATYLATLDWLKFATFFRGFGIEGGIFPEGSHRGACVSGTCRIWDWRVGSGAPLHNRSASGNASNESFVGGSDCPTGLNGSNAVTAGGSSFLLHAIEINNDHIGNNNSLCESNETCVYAPNMGSYQGEGDLLQPCTFIDGIVSGVRMHAYSISGQ